MPCKHLQGTTHCGAQGQVGAAFPVLWDPAQQAILPLIHKWTLMCLAINRPFAVYQPTSFC